MQKSLTLAGLLACSILAMGCEEKGPAERAGEALDNAADEIGDAGRDLGNAVEDACEDMKEGVNAKDTDC